MMCLSLPLFSQVTIKEKVVITPKENARTTLNAANSLTCVLTWSNGSTSISHYNVTAVSCAGTSTGASGTSGYLSTTLTDAKATDYNWSYDVHVLQGTYSFSFNVYLGDDIIFSKGATPTCPDPSGCTKSEASFCDFGGCHRIDLYDGFTFPNNQIVVHNNTMTISVGHGNQNCDTTSTLWSYNNSMTWTITQGADLGSLYKGTTKLGSTASGNNSGYFSDVTFKANGRQPCKTSGDTVIIEATSNGITRTDVFRVTPSNTTLDHFAVTISPDTISTCQPGAITAIAQAADSSEAFLDCDILVKLTTNGKFIRGSDTLSSPLTDVKYGDVKNGAIKVIPNGQTYLQTITVTVKKSSDTTKTGSGSVLFAIPIELEITVSQNPLRPLETGAPNQTTVTVKASRCNVPVNDLAISLEAHPVSNSGGHSHNVNRPKGTLASSGTTNVQGEFNTPYTSSKFGGEEWIVASSSTTSDKESVMVTIKIPDLSPITSGTGNILTVTSESAAQFHQLEYSDYATSTTRDAVYTAVRQYAQEFELSSAIFLAVNDMSLPNGGLFDIGGNWSSPHDWHRLGKSVDFSHFYRLANGHVTNIIFYRDGVPYDTTNTIDESKLDKFFKDLKSIGFSRHEKDIGLIHYQSKESGIVK